jgi:hypothetical protein
MQRPVLDNGEQKSVITFLIKIINGQQLIFAVPWMLIKKECYKL